MKTLSILLFCFLWIVPSWAMRGDCHIPTPEQLEEFFEKSNEWTEVESDSSHRIAYRKVIRLKINFKNPLESQIYKGDQSMGPIRSLCFNQKKNTLYLEAQERDIALSKMPNGALKSELRVYGFTFTYYYRPDTVVVKDQKDDQDSMQDWFNVPQSVL